ncbi:MAG: hypothetical protein ABSA75_10285 [Candidatus Bathyarchaeia archaeon]|jgi:hypothetical protein
MTYTDKTGLRHFIKTRTPKKHFQEWDFEKIDYKFLMEQLNIALNAYIKADYDNSGPLGNLMGIVSEFAFDGLLTALKLKYEWNIRRADKWEKPDERPWDFQLSNGTTFEIGSIRPFHQHAMLTASEHKLKSDYFVQVKILHLRLFGRASWKDMDRMLLFDANASGSEPREITDPTEIKEELEAQEKKVLATARIEGFDLISNIKAKKGLWRFSEKGEKLTPKEAAFCEPLEAIQNFPELIILLTGKPTLDNQPRKSSEQLHFRKKRS